MGAIGLQWVVLRVQCRAVVSISGRIPEMPPKDYLMNQSKMPSDISLLSPVLGAIGAVGVVGALGGGLAIADGMELCKRHV